MLAVEEMMVQPAAPAKSIREERKEKEATKHVQPPGTISAEEIAARLPLEPEMESVISLASIALPKSTSSQLPAQAVRTSHDDHAVYLGTFTLF